MTDTFTLVGLLYYDPETDELTNVSTETKETTDG